MSVPKSKRGDHSFNILDMCSNLYDTFYGFYCKIFEYNSALAGLWMLKPCQIVNDLIGHVTKALKSEPVSCEEQLRQYENWSQAVDCLNELEVIISQVESQQYRFPVKREDGKIIYKGLTNNELNVTYSLIVEIKVRCIREYDNMKHRLFAIHR